ncbi:MAG: DUF6174 domain-containing protein [Roseiflexaceae bacterium]|nr:DUF6174 domain-containing protein [Roseiflexaceae bacterium]
MNAKQRLMLISTLMFLVAAFGGLELLLNAAPRARAQELAHARALWEHRPFGAYKMTLEEFHCFQDIEVRNERVVAKQPWSRCQRDAKTITELFAIAQRDGDPGARCITLGCACDDQISVQTSYDPQYGYPQEIYIRIEPHPNWRHADFWTYTIRHFQIPDCDSFMAGDKLIRITAFEPLR